MAPDTEQLVRSAYRTFNEEHRAFPELWHPDGEYVNSRDDPDSAVHRGLEAIERLVQEWVGAYPDLRVEPLEIRVSGDLVFVWTRWTGRGASSGAAMEMELAHCWTLAGGRIVRIEEHFDRAEALAAAELAEEP